MKSKAFVVLLMIGASGCIGNIGDGGDGEGDDLGENAEGLGADDTRRLSPSEYIATLRSLFGDAAVDQVLTALAGLPNDRGKNEFTTMERGITAAHVDTYYSVAKGIADAVSVDPTLRARVHPCLESAQPDAACIEDAVDAFGLRAYRRPLQDSERSEILASFDEGDSQLSYEDGLALALMTILQSPAFLYRLELGAGTDAVPSFRLSAYELATRLAYFFTGAPPDDALLAAAANGALEDEAAYAAEVERLASSDAARDQVRRFFTEWLALDRVPVPQHSATFLDGIDPAAAAAEMRTELETLVEHHVFEAGSDFAALMSSNLAVPGQNLAQIYGVDAATTATPIGDGLRDGLLTRAAFLATSGEMTHPIQRGAFVMRAFLCDDIEVPPPSAELDITPPPYDPLKTARERWTANTSQSKCAACHERINAFGFALEKYDALGRYRALEPIVDPSTSTVVNELAIDDTVEVLLDDARVSVSGGTGLSQALATSASAQTCLARKWFRYVNGRRETAAEIAPMLDVAQDPEQAIHAVLVSVAKSPGFRMRKMEGGQP
ncbi:MAG TPA: DUF1592 domain-containing protein [Polyangiaceae bacterium]|jgi:hypothetical protein|nr:DUF1592 domain-containing protein [Polyangiaceae bacterium]